MKSHIHIIIEKSPFQKEHPALVCVSYLTMGQRVLYLIDSTYREVQFGGSFLGGEPHIAFIILYHTKCPP